MKNKEGGVDYIIRLIILLFLDIHIYIYSCRL